MKKSIKRLYDTVVYSFIIYIVTIIKIYVWDDLYLFNILDWRFLKEYLILLFIFTFFYFLMFKIKNK